MIEKLIEKIVNEISQCTFVKGIVLGGSRATGTATESSDIDIGIYYEKAEVDFDKLNYIAQQLDDTHREGLICREGEWGNWVNFGGWLVVEGYHVDLIFRDINRVKVIVAETDRGEISSHYQTGHPHGYISAMYRGELATSEILYSKDHEFTELKKQAEIYPEAMKKALISFFLFEGKFSCMFAKNYSKDGDIYYIIDHLFRSISALNQVLFALNRTYCLNEKKAILRIERFPIAPANYRRRINGILSLTHETLIVAVDKLEELCEEVEKLVDNI